MTLVIYSMTHQAHEQRALSLRRFIRFRNLTGVGVWRQRLQIDMVRHQVHKRLAACGVQTCLIADHFRLTHCRFARENKAAPI